MSIGSDQSTAGSVVSSRVRPIIRHFAVTNLSTKHNDFDFLLAELEADPVCAEEIASAGKWIAETFYSDEGATIRTARLALGMSQKSLASALETSQPQVAKIESGKVDLSHSTLVKLQRALGVDANALFTMIANQEQKASK